MLLCTFDSLRVKYSIFVPNGEKTESDVVQNGLKDTQLVFSLLKSHIHLKKYLTYVLETSGDCNFTFFRLLGVTSRIAQEIQS